MSFITRITARLFSKKSKTPEYFFALNIGLSEISAAIWKAFGGRAKISRQITVSYQGTEELVEKSYRALDKLTRELNIDPDKILFGIPDSWSIGDDLKEPYLRLLQKMLDEFGLQALAYVTTTSAISYLIQRDEGVPPSVVLLGLGDSVEAALLQNGETIENRAVKRSNNLFEDIEKTMRELSMGGTFPRRLLLYQTKSGMDLEKVKDELMSFTWMQRLPFSHFSEVKILEENIGLEAIVSAGAIDTGSGGGLGKFPLKIHHLATGFTDFLIHGNKFAMGVIILVIIAGGFGLRHFLTKTSGRQPDVSVYNEVPNELPSPTPDMGSTPDSSNYSTNNSSLTANPTSTPAPTAVPTPTPTPCAASSAADSGHSSISADPASLLADGSSKSVITVKVADSCGNILSGAVINLSTSDTGANFWSYSSGSNITNSSGQAQFNMTSTNGGHAYLHGYQKDFFYVYTK